MFYRAGTTRTRFDVRTFNITAGRRLGGDPDRSYRSDWFYRFYRFYLAGTTRTTPVPGWTCRIYWRYWTYARLRRRFQPGFPEAAFSVSGREIIGTRWRLWASPGSPGRREPPGAGSGRRSDWIYRSHWLHWTQALLVILASLDEPKRRDADETGDTGETGRPGHGSMYGRSRKD